MLRVDLESDASQAPSSKPIALLVGFVAAAALIVHARSYPVLTYDDAFISLRYAQRLVEGHGLTWTDGPPVEGYSNLLWVLGCAALGALGIDWVDTPIVLGVASALATLAAIIYAFPPRNWQTSLPALAGALFVALAGPIGLWAVSGLEGCLVAALLAWSLVSIRPVIDATARGWRSMLGPGIPLALLCLTRPDGPLLVVVICGFLLVRGRSIDAVRRAVAVGLLPGLATLGQVGFRLWYYGDWLPNTARAKVAFTLARMQDGGQCVAAAAQSSAALWVPALLALYVAFVDARRRPHIALTATLLAAWTIYAVTVTCQPYGYRILIPSYLLLAFLLAYALDWVVEQGAVVTAMAWLATMGLLIAFARAQQADKNIAMAHWRNPPISVMAATVGNTLREAFEDRDPLVAVDAAGAIPFYSGLRSLDMLGLNDAHIARHHDASFGHGVQGHELGDGDYVLSAKPDIIVAGVLGSSRLAFRGGREMDKDPRFHQWYRNVRVRGEEPYPTRFSIFCRLEGRVGLRRSEGQVVVPGYLFATTRGTEARLDANGSLVTRFLKPAEAAVRGIALPAGTWRITAIGQGPLRLSARSDSGEPATMLGSDAVELTLAAPSTVDVQVTGAEGAGIEEVTIGNRQTGARE
ncbi:MAG: hypothetical protein PVH21_14130 [Myxococcales bacterium]|jgi:hypothetical protein